MTPSGAHSLHIGPAFLNSLRRVSLLASDKSNSIKLNFSKNNIDITANTPEVGEAKESLPVAYKGREFSIAIAT